MSASILRMRFLAVQNILNHTQAAQACDDAIALLDGSDGSCWMPEVNS